MFHHVVMFAFKPGTDSGQIAGVVKALEDLPSLMPMVRSFQVGRDTGRAEGNYDLVVLVGFDNQDDYLAYRDGPPHQRVVQEVIRPVLEHRVAVQFSS